ncbi:DPP IV N-terminal domain-containing protein, partial [candidate division KSB1 bacterium]
MKGFLNFRMGKVYSYLIPSLLVVLIIFLTTAPIFAQETVKRPKPNYELANKFNNIRSYVYDTSVRPNWIEETDMFWYTYRNSNGRFYYLVDPVKKTKTEVFDRGKFAAAMSERFHKPIDPTQLDSYNFKFVNDMKAVEFIMMDSVKFQYDLVANKLDSIGIADADDRRGGGGQRGGRGGGGRGGGGSNFKNFSPDSTMFAYSKNYNLYVMGADSMEVQLTFDGVEDYSFGGDTSLTRKTRASVSWSEDSKRFYVQRRDSRNLGKLYLVNEVKAAPDGSPLTYARPELVEYNYTMPGDENVSQTEMFIFTKDTKEFKPVPIEKWKDQRLSSVRWGKNSNEIYFQRKDRTQDRHDVNIYYADTNEVKTLIYEYIENSYVETKGISYLEDFSEYIWWSERTGWGHFYLYDYDGTLKNPITSGAFLATGIAEIDTTARVLYFNGVGREPGENPYYSHLYRVNFDGTGLTLLNPGDASHSASLSPSNKFFVDSYSRVDMAPVSELRDNQGNLVMKLEEYDMSGLNEIGWQFPEKFKVKSADGVYDIYGVMWKPVDFDPEMKYPIIAHVYPGPQTESVPATFSATNRNNTLAQLGFIVIAIGNRGGSPDRSKAYHNYGYGNLRDYGLADKKAGIEQLASRYSFIDIEKVGIYGHSGGGFMSTAALVVPPYNEFFHVAVSSSGNHDNNMYNQNWSEKHHGVKEVTSSGREEQTTQGRAGRAGRGGQQTGQRGRGGQQTQGQRGRGGQQEEEAEDEIRFEITVPANHEMAENLKGHLLLVHGTMDNNVHPGNTIRMADALIKANKRFDLMMMPGQAH